MRREICILLLRFFLPLVFTLRLPDPPPKSLTPNLTGLETLTYLWECRSGRNSQIHAPTFEHCALAIAKLSYSHDAMFRLPKYETSESCLVSITQVSSFTPSIGPRDDVVNTARALWIGCRNIVPYGYFLGGQTIGGERGIAVTLSGIGVGANNMTVMGNPSQS